MDRIRGQTIWFAIEHYADRDCKELVVKMTNIYLIDKIEWQGKHYATLDLSLLKEEAAIYNPFKLVSANRTQLGGYTDWRVGALPKDVTGKN